MADSPDWTAITQAIGAGVQAFAAVITLRAAYALAKRSHDDAERRDAANDRRKVEDQENAAGVLMQAVRAAVAECVSSALSTNDADWRFRQHEIARSLLLRWLDRADRLAIENLSSQAAWQFLQCTRIGHSCVGVMGLKYGLGTEDVAGDLQRLLKQIDDAHKAFERATGRPVALGSG